MRVSVRWLIITVGGVFPALALGYAIGFLTHDRDPAEPADPAATVAVELVPNLPEPVLPDLSAGPRPPGVWEWKELRGGECIGGFDPGSIKSLLVVDCAVTHDAQFVRASLVDPDPARAYPGDAVIASHAEALCATWDRNSLSTPEQYDDLLVVAAYTPGEAAWLAGDRLMGCFVYRQGPDGFTSPLVP